MPSEQVRYTSGQRIPTRGVVEIEAAMSRALADPEAALEVDVEFTDPDGQQRVAPAFWAGGRSWKARYSSPIEGRHRFRWRVSSGTDGGLDGLSGEVTVTRYTGVNPLLRHGGPAVGDDGRHLIHEDGKPFLWLADTWWTAMMARFEWPDIFQRLADDRAAKGFNVVQIVAGLVPEFQPFGPEMASEGGQPWTESGKGSLNPDFFAIPDEKIDYLVGLGISPCIVGGWGYYGDYLGADHILRHWRHLVARYGAYPVTWCIAGEVDLPQRVHTSAPSGLVRPDDQVAMWEAASTMVGRIDPYRRIRTVHPCPVFTYASSEAFASRDSFDLDMLQTGHTGFNCVPSTMTHLRQALAFGDKPVLNGECSYEGIFDACWQDVQRFLFWSHMLSGTAGHTYGTMAIGTFNRKDDPHVPLSTVSMHYWDDAIDWLGAAHVGIGRRILERLDWWRLAPAQEIVEPHAGPDDWFLPYAARAEGGRSVVYFPGAGTLRSNGAIADWPRQLSRVTILSLIPGVRHRCTWINPRTGVNDSTFTIDPGDGSHVIESGRSWIMPTGEDWVLLIEPESAGS